MDQTSPEAQRATRRFWLGLVLGLLTGATGAWIIGFFNNFGRQPFHAVEETKLCYIALSSKNLQLQPQTREYLKGRLYWNAAVWVEPGWLEDWHIDFGPVDDGILAGLTFVKDGSASEEVYRNALSKHPKAASKP